jgi:ribosomal protein L10
MNSSLNSKKNFQIHKIKNHLQTKDFIGLYNLNVIDVSKRIDLKSIFSKSGFKIQVVNNRLFKKAIDLHFSEYKNLAPLSQGFLLLVTPDTDSKTDPIKLKELFLDLRKKEKTLFFLGGIFNKTLINDNFVQQVSTIKTQSEIFSEIIYFLEKPGTEITNHLNSIQTGLTCLIDKRA